ncbi:MAG: SDR family NAD(P)-dependent oxidoreductase [Myxococcota bacterium]
MTADIERWRGRVAVVSGASAGIGASVARALSQSGLKVAIGARRIEPLEALVKERGDASVWAHPLDVQSADSVDAFYAALLSHWGTVDVLVNNAGVGFRGDLWTQPVEQWASMLDVNVLGLLRMTQPALQQMMANGRGHIFNVSSMAGHRVPPRTSVYSATKYAVGALTEGLRKDLRSVKSPVRVTAISPGFVNTEFIDAYIGNADEAKSIREGYPLLTGADVASAVVYALGAPDHMQVHDVLIRPTDQPN